MVWLFIGVYIINRTLYMVAWRYEISLLVFKDTINIQYIY